MKKLKILFTTSLGNVKEGVTYNYFSGAMPEKYFSFKWFFPPTGIYFLKENIPDMDILVYPTENHFIERIKKGVDILGISFFTYQFNDVKKMVKIAREYHVKEIWGGNYGILTPGSEKIFDKIFIGYSEEKIYKMVYGKQIERIKHPPLVTLMFSPAFPNFYGKVGLVFTTRGCPLKCSFCQTPVFTKGYYKMPRDSIYEVIKFYRKKGIRAIIFADEFFNPWINMDIIELCKKLGVKWFAQARFDVVKGRVKELSQLGMIGGLFGIESLREKNLDFINKKLSPDIIFETINEMAKHNMFIQGTYMFGYEDDTEDSILEDIKILKKLPLLVYHIFVLTPFPKTPLWDYIKDKYGIFEKDWSKFNSWHLVWNHPNISKGKMEKLVNYARKVGWGKIRYIKTVLNILLKAHDSIRYREFIK